MSAGSIDHFRQIFLRWERWRIWYNLALVGVVFVVAYPALGVVADWALFGQLGWRCTVGAIVVNICYFAGPIAESYLHWLGLRNRAITPTLFFSGLVLSMLLTALCVLGLAFGPDDF